MRTIFNYLRPLLGVFSGAFVAKRTDFSRWTDIDLTTYQGMREDKKNLRQDFTNITQDISKAIKTTIV